MSYYAYRGACSLGAWVLLPLVLVRAVQCYKTRKTTRRTSLQIAAS